MLDVLLIGIVLVFGLVGFMSGFWRQVMRLFVLVIAYLLSGVVGRPLGASIAAKLGIQPLLGQTLGTYATFLGVYLVLSFTTWAILRRGGHRIGLGSSSQRKMWDSMLGAAFGSAKAFMIVFLLLCAAILVEPSIRGPLEKSKLGYDKSILVGLARGHNVLEGWSLPLVGDLGTLSKISSDPAFRQKVAADPQIVNLLQHPKIQGVLNDRAIQQASRQQNMAALVSNPQLNKVLQDPEIRKLFSQIDLSKLK